MSSKSKKKIVPIKHKPSIEDKFNEAKEQILNIITAQIKIDDMVPKMFETRQFLLAWLNRVPEFQEVKEAMLIIKAAHENTKDIFASLTLDSLQLSKDIDSPFDKLIPDSVDNDEELLRCAIAFNAYKPFERHFWNLHEVVNNDED